MNDIVYGKNSVYELLAQGKRSVSKILIMKGMKPNDKISQIIDLAKSKGIVFQFLPKEKFLQYKEYTHQGVIAFVAPIKYKDFEDFLRVPKKYKKVIITDGIEDPHNMGSIIRTAVCAGFDGIIFPSRRNTPINATVEKSSAGAINHIDMIMVNSLSSIIDKLKNENYWIIATDMKAKDNYYDIDYCNMNFAIVMGSEKEGISSTIMKKADYRIKIPMLNGFDSLNVANAASIIMYEALKQSLQNSQSVV